MSETSDLFGVPETFAAEIEIRESDGVTYMVAKNHAGPAHCFVMTRDAYHQLLKKMCGGFDTLN